MKAIFGFKIIIATLFSFLWVDGQAQNTEIKVTDIRSSKGQIILSIYKDEKAFTDGKPFKVIPYDKKDIIDKTLVLKCDLEPGTYGIALLDDENKNGKMEKNFVGAPKEGFGFSNFFMEKLKRPTFSDFKTNISSKGNKINIRVKYM